MFIVLNILYGILIYIILRKVTKKITILDLFSISMIVFLVGGYLEYASEIPYYIYFKIFIANTVFIFVSLLVFIALKSIKFVRLFVNEPLINYYPSKKVFIITFFVSLLVLFIKIHLSGGIISLLRNPLFFTINITRYKFAFLTILYSFSYSFFIFFVPNSPNMVIKLILFTFTVMVIFEGTRWPLLVIGLIFFMSLKKHALEIFIEKPFLTWILIFSIGVPLSLIAMPLLNFYRNYGYFSFHGISLDDFNPIYNFHLLFRRTFEYKLFIPYMFLLTGYEFIPRLIFPYKLPTDPQYYFTTEFFGSYEYRTYTLTIPGELYYEAGWVGIILGAIIYGSLSFYYYQTMVNLPGKLHDNIVKTYNYLLYSFILLWTISGYRTTLKNSVFSFIIVIILYKCLYKIISPTRIRDK